MSACTWHTSLSCPCTHSGRSTLVKIRFPWIGFGLVLCPPSPARRRHQFLAGTPPRHFCVGCFFNGVSQKMRGPSRSHSGPHGKFGPGHFILLSVVRYPLSGSSRGVFDGHSRIWFRLCEDGRKERCRHSGNVGIMRANDVAIDEMRGVLGDGHQELIAECVPPLRRGDQHLFCGGSARFIRARLRTASSFPLSLVHATGVSFGNRFGFHLR